MKRLKEKINYKFNNFMTKNGASQILGLAVIVIFIILIGALFALFFLTLFHTGEVPEDMGKTFLDKMWWTFMRIMDPGTIVGDSGVTTRIISLFATIGGILIFSILIGILSNKIEEKLETLKKGKTRVIEKNHTIILGWSEKVFTIIEELIIANENQRRGVVVIMSEKSTVDMYDEINNRISNFKTTDVICRTGDPISIVDLEIVNLNRAKSIIILSDETKESDMKVVKITLAIINNKNRKKDKFHIVTELLDMNNRDIIKMIGKDEVEILVINDIISRQVVQISRQAGLSVVYNEILSFAGNELYFIEDANAYGNVFSDLLFGYLESIPVGFLRNSTVHLNPDPSIKIVKGDKIIALTEDDDTCIFTGIAKKFNQKIIISNKIEHIIKPEKTLVFGWNKEIFFIIAEIDKYVQPNSILTIIAKLPKSEAEERIRENLSTKQILNVKLSYKQVDYTTKKHIETLHPENYENIIVLSDTTDKDKNVEERDAETLITILFLREIMKNSGKNGTNIVSEMINPKNKELAEVTQINDFIVSSKILSMILAQISEQKEITLLYNELFKPEGNEIYLKPISNYIQVPNKVNFYTLLKAASDVNQIAIGYRIKKYEHDKKRNYGTVVNPNKNEFIEFTKEDSIVVISKE